MPPRRSARGPADTVLPDGWRVVVDRHVVALDGGRVLLGGAPPRMLRLAPAGRALLAGGGFTVTDATSRALARRLLDGGVVHPVPDGAGPGPGDVTVVVPVKDRTDAVARLIAALPPDLGGVIVVDDGSADPHALLAAVHGPARRRCTEVRVLRHDHPRGPAAARNAGLAAATTPLVAFLDSDVLPTPGWLDPLLAHLADPAVGLVAPGSSPWHRRVAGRHSRRSAAGSAGTRRCGRRWTWARTRPSSCRAPGSPTSPARRCSCAARPSGRDSTTTCTSPRTSTWCCACTARAGGCATSRRRGSRTTTAPSCARGGCARRTTGPARPRSRCATAARCRRWC